MEIDKSKIIKMNKEFGGSLINEGSLDFAIQGAKKQKDIFKSNAYLVRGIITDHAFFDGSKRTAIKLITRRFSKRKIKCDKEGLTKGIISIAKDNIRDINKISGRLRKWCKKY